MFLEFTGFGGMVSIKVSTIVGIEQIVNGENKPYTEITTEHGSYCVREDYDTVKMAMHRFLGV